MPRHEPSEHHRRAAHHHEKAAQHHRQASKYHDDGKTHRGASHAHAAHGHAQHATHHANAASARHADEHDDMYGNSYENERDRRGRDDEAGYDEDNRGGYGRHSRADDEDEDKGPSSRGHDKAKRGGKPGRNGHRAAH